MALDLYGAFFLYASFSVLLLAWGYFFLPDNKGLSLVASSEKYEGAQRKRRTQMRRRDQRRRRRRKRRMAGNETVSAKAGSALAKAPHMI